MHKNQFNMVKRLGCKQEIIKYIENTDKTFYNISFSDSFMGSSPIARITKEN